MICILIPKVCKCKSDRCIYTVDSAVDVCLLNPFKMYHLHMFGKWYAIPSQNLNEKKCKSSICINNIWQKEIIWLRSGSDLHLHADPSGETRTCTLCYLHNTFGSLPFFIPNLHSCIPQTKYARRKLHPL